MSVQNFNVLSAKKSINTIRHRLNEDGLDPAIRARIIDRQLLDLLDTLPAGSPVVDLLHAVRADEVGVYARHPELLVQVLDLLERWLPSPSYGAAVAGTVFRLTPTDHAALFIKRKDGVQRAGELDLYPHFDPAARIWPANGDLL